MFTVRFDVPNKSLPIVGEIIYSLCQPDADVGIDYPPPDGPIPVVPHAGSRRGERSGDAAWEAPLARKPSRNGRVDRSPSGVEPQ
jgi:hypothetical protein